MAILQVYLHWANSILSDIKQEIEGIKSIQDGKVLCQIVDILHPDAGLQRKVNLSGSISAQSYIQSVLNHMRNNGIKINFKAQDVEDGDIKSMLDVLWLLILNYSIHNLDIPVQQRSVGLGKKILLEWCEQELDAHFDPKNTLAYNLCTGDWFIKLLCKHTGPSSNPNEDKSTLLPKLFDAMQNRYGIMNTIIRPSDIIEGSVDEHTMMIYLALMRRKLNQEQERKEKEIRQARQKFHERPPVSKLPIKKTPNHISRARHNNSSENSTVMDSTDNDTSDWMSSSNDIDVQYIDRQQLSKEQTNKQPPDDSDPMILQTISEKVSEHIRTPNGEPKQYNRPDLFMTSGSIKPDFISESEEVISGSESARSETNFSHLPGKQRMQNSFNQQNSVSNPNQLDLTQVQQLQEQYLTQFPGFFARIGPGFIIPNEQGQNVFMLMNGAKMSTGQDQFSGIDPSRYTNSEQTDVKKFSPGGDEHWTQRIKNGIQVVKSSASNDVDQSVLDDITEDQSREILSSNDNGDTENTIRKQRERAKNAYNKRMIQERMENNNNIPSMVRNTNDDILRAHTDLETHFRPISEARDDTEQRMHRIGDIASSTPRAEPSFMEAGQSREKALVQLLLQEIGELKTKITQLEGAKNNRISPSANQSSNESADRLASRSSTERSPRLGYSTASSWISSTDIDDAFEKEILHHSNELKRQRSPEVNERGRRADRLARSDMLSRRRRNMASSSPVNRRRGAYSSNELGQPDRRSHSLQDLRSADDNEDLFESFVKSPGLQKKDVRFGYTSPARNVNEEIWGYDFDDLESLDPKKIAEWKGLVLKRKMTESDTVKLKSSLASAIVENDILAAKLRNANRNMDDKMRKTMQILNDCKMHLSKAQAENAELRSQAEKERSRADSMEERIKQLEEKLFSASSRKDQLESDLIKFSTSFNVSSSSISGQEMSDLKNLHDENQHLASKLQEAERQHMFTEGDMNRLQRSLDKSQSTITELNDCLDEAKKERNQLFEEIMRLQKLCYASKVNGIIDSYQEKGLYSETNAGESTLNRNEPLQSTAISDKPTDVSFTPQRIRSLSADRLSDRTSKVLTSSPSVSNVGNVTASPLNKRVGIKDTSRYNFDAISPIHPSSNHEIYPHRRQHSYAANRSKFYNLNEPETPSISHCNGEKCTPSPIKDGAFSIDRISWAPVKEKRSVNRSEITRDMSPERISHDRHLSFHTPKSDSSIGTNISGRSFVDVIAADISDSINSPEKIHNSPSIRRQYSDKDDGFMDDSLPRRLSYNDSSTSRVHSFHSSFHDQHSSSPYKSMSASVGTSPRRGILKRSFHASPARSNSPRHIPAEHPYSPRRTPEPESDVDYEIVRNLQQDFDTSCSGEPERMRNMSWYDLSLDNPPCLTDNQRRYADRLIKKYTRLPTDRSLPI